MRNWQHNGEQRQGLEVCGGHSGRMEWRRSVCWKEDWGVGGESVEPN